VRQTETERRPALKPRSQSSRWVARTRQDRDEARASRIRVGQCFTPRLQSGRTATHLLLIALRTSALPLDSAEAAGNAKLALRRAVTDSVTPRHEREQRVLDHKLRVPGCSCWSEVTSVAEDPVGSGEWRHRAVDGVECDAILLAERLHIGDDDLIVSARFGARSVRLHG